MFFNIETYLLLLNILSVILVIDSLTRYYKIAFAIDVVQHLNY